MNKAGQHSSKACAARQSTRSACVPTSFSIMMMGESIPLSTSISMALEMLRSKVKSVVRGSGVW